MNRKGFVLIEIFLLIFVAMVLGGTGWYVWNAKKETDKNFNDSNSASNSTFLYASRPNEDIAPDGWEFYANHEGDYAFYYPPSWILQDKGCNPGLVLLGANERSTGRCGTESFGQIIIYAKEGPPTSTSGTYLREADGYTNIRWHDAPEAGGIIGTKMSGEASGQVRESEIGTTGLPDGTEVTLYVFYDQDDDRTHTATYIQLDSYPDVLADFDRMVSTLVFEL